MAEPTKAAMRAAHWLNEDAKANWEPGDGELSQRSDEDLASIIDEETGLPGLIEALSNTLVAFRALSWNHSGDAIANAVIAHAEAALLKANGE